MQLMEMENIFDAMGKRERKQRYTTGKHFAKTFQHNSNFKSFNGWQTSGYDVDSYYREALSVNKQNKCLIQKPHKMPKMADFQVPANPLYVGCDLFYEILLKASMHNNIIIPPFSSLTQTALERSSRKKIASFQNTSTVPILLNSAVHAIENITVVP